MQSYFGRQGVLAQKVPGFEFRFSQLELAEAVFAGLKDGSPLLAEAGTGTGKTWAYLIPAVLSGQRVVVSTGTKTLQDQILDHDIPFLKKHVFPGLRAVCLKGRRNYLCRRKFGLFAHQPTLWDKEETRLFRRLQEWASSTGSGDRAEINWLPDNFHIWNEVSSNSEQCLGQQCPDFSRCFLSLLREEASRADLLIVNHHLYFADLALRVDGRGEILPDYDAVIFDEAHQLEDVISLYFGLEFSNAKINELAQDIRRESTRKSFQIKNIEEVLKILEHLEISSRNFQQQLLSVRGSPGRFPLDLDRVDSNFARTCQEMIHALEMLNAHLSLSRDNHPVLESFSRRTSHLALIIKDILDQPDPSLVYWYELSPRSVFVHGTPLEVGTICTRWLFGQTSKIVFTSATLTIAGSFEFVRRNLGMPSETRELRLASPFAYEQQTLLYIPEHLPLPQAPHFCDSVAKEAAKILTKTKGRALFLFTSYKNLNVLHRHLADVLPYPILVQGQRPKRQLLTEFKQKIDSVLLATSSFWHGIDVPGEALSCLLIDKLPFEVPEDPLIAARMEYLANQGKNPFYNYQVPRAIIHLKQGMGRLIRSAKDRGIIAIFDIRLFSKNYGKLFLESLPPCRMTREIHDLDHFFSLPCDSKSPRPRASNESKSRSAP